MGTRQLPNAIHFKEFYGGYHGTCGETALATALVCASPQIENEQDAINLMLAMTKEMIGLGWADSTGATTEQHLFDETKRRGFSPDVSTFISYQTELDLTKLHSLLLSLAGVKPIVIEIAKAYALPGDESGVDYHFICIVGITDAGYICNDGDNSAIEQHLITYSWAEIEAANPCAVMTIEMEQMPVPTGWKDDGTILTAPNGGTAEHAYRAYIMNDTSWPAELMPVGQDYGVSGGTRHDFTYCLEWDSASGQTKPVQGKDYSKAAAPVDPSVKVALAQALNLLNPQATLASEVSAALKTLG